MKFVGRVTVDFVGRHKDENGVEAMPPRDFQQIHGADGVDVKIVERAAGSQIVAGLGGRVYDQVEGTFRLEETGKPGAVADIHVIVMKMTRRFVQPLQVPPRVPFRAEEVGPHVVIDTDNTLRAAVEEADKLRTDKPTGTSDKYFQDQPRRESTLCRASDAC